ncbi:hypothetical protein IMZ17_16925 [Geobacillus stearothermophilus]|nr:hypothetical protein IMZ17_16925 [Geobacillus stearothermophilus]
MEQGEQMPWLLDSRHVEMECLKEIVKSLSYTKEGSSPQHVLDKQYGFLHKDVQKSLIC